MEELCANTYNNMQSPLDDIVKTLKVAVNERDGISGSVEQPNQNSETPKS